MECDKQIVADISLESGEAMRSIQKMTASKYMNAPAKGKATKLSIINQLILSQKQMSLLTGLYETVLPTFKILCCYAVMLCCSRKRNQWFTRPFLSNSNL